MHEFSFWLLAMVCTLYTFSRSCVIEPPLFSHHFTLLGTADPTKLYVA